MGNTDPVSREKIETYPASRGFFRSIGVGSIPYPAAFSLFALFALYISPIARIFSNLWPSIIHICHTLIRAALIKDFLRKKIFALIKPQIYKLIPTQLLYYRQCNYSETSQ